MELPITIERRVLIRAPLETVWNTIGTPQGVSEWFKVTIEGEWAQGGRVVLRWENGHSEIELIQISPPHILIYRWHPGGSHMISDLPESELTTVTFRLLGVEGGTEMILEEVGFEAIPEDRQLRVLGLNTEGWDDEIKSIRSHAER